MPELIREPSRVAAAGEPPKLIDEYVGRVNTGQARLSIAHMRSPSGWAEPGQRPEFDEFTVVLRGALVVESDDACAAASPQSLLAGERSLGIGEGRLTHQHVSAVGERERGIAQPGVHDERETLARPRLAHLLDRHQAVAGDQAALALQPPDVRPGDAGGPSSSHSSR
jgi:hypothetical protein